MLFVRTNISLYPPFSVANPAGAFWTLVPGSGIGFFRTWMLDPGSQTDIFDVPLMTNFGVNSITFLSVLVKKENYLQFFDICGYKKMVGQKIFLLVQFLDPGSGMDKNQDPGSGDKYPGSATLLGYLDQGNRTLCISCCINTFFTHYFMVQNKR